VKKAQKTKKQRKGVRSDIDVIATKLRGGDEGGKRKKAKPSLTDKAKG